MSKETKKNQHNHADWSAEKPSKKASNTGYSSKKEMTDNKKSSLDDHFERYNSKNSSHKNNDSSFDDYQD